MELQNLTYSIQQVAEITGLSKQLIRKWEDRYAVISPQRLDNGYRVYTEQEISMLNQMKELTQHGHSAKQAAHILQLQASDEANEQASRNPRADAFIAELVGYGAAGNDVLLMQTLQQAHHVLGAEVLLDEVITPFLQKVGDYWCDQSWGEYQEAMSSLTVRDFLGHLRRTIHVPDEAPLVLGSCLFGERHELPMHILLVKCMLRGYRTAMLGPAPAPQAIASLVTAIAPAVVLLTVTTPDSYMPHAPEVLVLDMFAQDNPHIAFYVGGPSSAGLFEAFDLKGLRQADSLEDAGLAEG